jgi:Zn-dependent protease with chaperone function
MELSGLYYDGCTSRSSAVRLSFCRDGTVDISGEGVSLRFPLAALDISSRVGNTPRAIALPNGGRCEIKDNDGLDSVLVKCGGARPQHWIHRLETSLRYVAAATVITALFAWAMIDHGIPWLAEQAAYALPRDVDRALGQGTLDVLDRQWFSESTLDQTRRAQLEARFLAMTATLESPDSYRLEFRAGGDIGANAFALPSGIVVMTDELVALSENDDQLVAVLAHEIGHLEHRHSLRMVMQDSALALVISAVTGDPFSTSTLAVALPTLLAHAGYSREFETEADDYAYRYLVANGIPTEAFANILVRLGGDGETSTVERFLSSHPGTRERIARFRNSP